MAVILPAVGESLSTNGTGNHTQDVKTRGGFVSVKNSTTSTLGGGATFTGASEDALHYSSVSLSWASDVASADDGVTMEFSSDATNWDFKHTLHSHSDTSLSSSHVGFHRMPVMARFFRVVFINGSGAQGSFRLQTIFHTDNSLPSATRLEDQMSTTYDLMAVRPAGKASIEIARRQITGQRSFFFFGFNADIGTSFEDIHPNGGDINWLTGATIVEVLSSDAVDTDTAGVGVRSVEIHGLDVNGEDQDEVILMNGTSAVASSKSYCRINKMHNETVGTYGGSHQGNVTCRVTGGGDTLSLMTGQEGSVDSSVQYGSGEAGNGYWSVPLGKVAYLIGGTVFIQASGNNTADVTLYEREGILNVSAPMDPRRVLWNVVQGKGIVPVEFDSLRKIKPITDIFFRAKGSANGTKVQVYLEYYVLDVNEAGE